MATVVAEMTMSLDGFVADPSDGVDELFGWYANGDVAVPSVDPDRSFHVSEASAGHLRHLLNKLGAIVSGRRMFDVADGWKGGHPLGVPVLVVTHTVPEGWPREDTDLSFVTDGVESAVHQAKSIVGDRPVLPRRLALIGPQDPVRPRQPRQGSGGTLGIEVLHG
jgi:dihydrofolate reductase